MPSRFVMPQADAGAGISPSDGAQLFFFTTGTANKLATYSDSAGTILNANPVIADANGVFPEIWIIGTYKVVLKDKNGVQAGFGVADPVSSDGSTASGIKNFATLALAIADTGLVDGDALSIAERTTGNGGGGMWDVALLSSTTLTANTIIAWGNNTGAATDLALVLRPLDSISIIQTGAIAEDKSNYAAASNQIANYTAIRAAIEYAVANGIGEVYFPTSPTNLSGYFVSASIRLYTDNLTIRFDDSVKVIRKYSEDTTGTNIPASSEALINAVRRVGDVWSGSEILTGTQINNLTLINVIPDGSRQVWDTQITSSNNPGFNGPTNLNLIFIKGLTMINCRGENAYKFDMKMHSCQDFNIDFYETINPGGMGIAWTGGNKKGRLGGYYAETQDEGTGAGVGRAIHGFDCEPDDAAVSGDDVFDYETSDVEIGKGTIKGFLSGFSIFPNPNATGAKAKMDVKRVTIGQTNIVASSSDNTALVTLGDGNAITWREIDITLGEIDAGAEGGTRITNGAQALLCENIEHLNIYGGSLMSYVDGAPTDAVQFASIKHLNWEDFNIGVPNVGGDGIIYTNCFNVEVDGFVTMADNSPAHQISRDSNTDEWENITIAGTIERGYILATRQIAGALCSGLTIPYLNYKGHSTSDFVIDIKHDIYNVSIGPVKRVEPTDGIGKIRLALLDTKLPTRNLLLNDFIECEIDYGAVDYTADQIAIIHKDIIRSNSAAPTLDAQAGCTRLAIFEANSTTLSTITNPRYGQTITIWFQGTGNTLTNNTTIATSTGANKAFAAGKSTQLVYLADSTGTAAGSKWHEITH